jgi:tetratricopeptide (TPR) repeat protein
MNQGFVAVFYIFFLCSARTVIAGVTIKEKTPITGEAYGNRSDAAFEQDSTEKYFNTMKEIKKLKISGVNQKAVKLINEGEKRLFEKNDLAGAAHYFQMAKNVDPNNRLLVRCLSYLYQEVGDFRKALEVWTQAAENDPKNRIDFISNRVALYTKLGMYEEALKDSQECLKYRQDIPSYWRNHARLLVKLKRYEEASRAYQNGFDLDKDVVIKSDNAMCAELKANNAMTQACIPVMN